MFLFYTFLFKIFLRGFYAKTQFYRHPFSGRAVRLLGLTQVLGLTRFFSFRWFRRSIG